MILEKIGQSGKGSWHRQGRNALARTEERLRDRRLILKKGSFSDMETILHSRRIAGAMESSLTLGFDDAAQDLAGFSFRRMKGLICGWTDPRSVRHGMW
jgi:hypothetical protein